eukprot:gene9974-7852_t
MYLAELGVLAVCGLVRTHEHMDVTDELSLTACQSVLPGDMGHGTVGSRQVWAVLGPSCAAQHSRAGECCLRHKQPITRPSSHPELFRAAARKPSFPLLTGSACQQTGNRLLVLPQCSASDTGLGGSAPTSKAKPTKRVPKAVTDSMSSAPTSEAKPAKRVPKADTDSGSSAPTSEAKPAKHVPKADTDSGSSAPTSEASEAKPAKRVPKTDTDSTATEIPSKAKPAKRVPKADTDSIASAPPSEPKLAKRVSKAEEDSPARATPSKAKPVKPARRVPKADEDSTATPTPSKAEPAKLVPKADADCTATPTPSKAEPAKLVPKADADCTATPTPSKAEPAKLVPKADADCTATPTPSKAEPAKLVPKADADCTASATPTAVSPGIKTPAPDSASATASPHRTAILSHSPAPQLMDTGLEKEGVEKKSNLLHVVSELKARLEKAGRVSSPIIAYGNRLTYETWGADTFDDVIVDEVEVEEFRCEICGQRSKSLKAFEKHFKIHEKEHAKKRGQKGVKAGGKAKKALAKYAKSEKAARFRDAAGRMESLSTGMGHYRLGMSWQSLKVLLNKRNVRLTDVSEMAMDADLAIYVHAQELMEELTTALSPQRDGDGDASHVNHTLVVVSDDYRLRGIWNQARGKGWSTILVCPAVVAPKYTTSSVDAVIHWEDLVVGCGEGQYAFMADDLDEVEQHGFEGTPSAWSSADHFLYDFLGFGGEDW